MNFTQSYSKNKMKIEAVLDKEEMAELKLSLLDITLDATNGQHTERGKTAVYRIVGMFRGLFVADVEEAVLDGRQL